MKTPLNLQKAATLAGVSILAAGLSGMAAADGQANGEALTELDDGYEATAKAETEGKCGEGKCGEGKCGGDSHDKAEGEGKCGEGKCGEGKCGEGKCGGDSHDKEGEGKCGEGKCGEGKCGAE